MVDCSTCKGTGQVHGQWDKVPGGRLIRCPICLGAKQVESNPGHSGKSSDTTGSTSPCQSLIDENAPPKQNAEPSRPISTDKEIINDDWIDNYRVGNTVDKTPMLNKRSGTAIIILSIFIIILAAILYQQFNRISVFENETLILQANIQDSQNTITEVSSANDLLSSQIIKLEESSEITEIDLSSSRKSLEESTHENLELQKSMQDLLDENSDLQKASNVQIKEINDLTHQSKLKDQSNETINQRLEDVLNELSNVVSERDLLLKELKSVREDKESLSKKLTSMLMEEPKESEQQEFEGYFNGHPENKRNEVIHVQMNAQQILRGFVECDCSVVVQDSAGEKILNLGDRVGSRNFEFTSPNSGKYSIILHYHFSNAWAPYNLDYSLYTYYAHQD